MSMAFALTLVAAAAFIYYLTRVQLLKDRDDIDKIIEADEDSYSQYSSTVTNAIAATKKTTPGPKSTKTHPSGFLTMALCPTATTSVTTTTTTAISTLIPTTSTSTTTSSSTATPTTTPIPTTTPPATTTPPPTTTPIPTTTTAPTTTTLSSTTTTTKPQPVYVDIMHLHLLLEIEDYFKGINTFLHPGAERSNVDEYCDISPVMCVLDKIKEGKYETSEANCNKIPRACRYVEIYIDSQSKDPKINRNEEFSKLPYGSRYLLIPDDCQKSDVLREMCRLRGADVGPPPDPNVFPDIQIMLGRFDGMLHINKTSRRWNQFNSEQYARYFKKGVIKHDFNYICCYMIHLAGCYDYGEYHERVCYAIRFVQIFYQKKLSALGLIEGKTLYGFPNPMTPFNKYWDKGFSGKYRYRVFNNPVYFERDVVLLKRDCHEGSSEHVRLVMCAIAGYPVHQDYYKPKDIVDMDSVIT